MGVDNIKEFFKYILKEIWLEAKALFTSLYQPKSWFYIFSTIFIIVIILGNKTSLIISYIMMVFLYILKEYHAGHWKHEMRQKYGKQ